MILFPKISCFKTLITNPSFNASEHDRAKYDKILKDVKEILTDEGVVNSIMKEFDKSTESREEFYQNREIRIKRLLAKAGYVSDDDYELYLNALSVSKKGYSIILERDIDEIFVNPYNPEWILAWNGNMDLQICLDFYAVITYITDYFTKDDTGTLEYMVEAIKNSDSESLKEKMTLLMNTFITHLQMGEAEAVYKIFPDFHFKESNISTVFFPNSPKEDRSKFLVRVDDKPQYANLQTLKIDNREGEYIEKHDIISKYQRREGLELISAAQFT